MVNDIFFTSVEEGVYTPENSGMKLYQIVQNKAKTADLSGIAAF